MMRTYGAQPLRSAGATIVLALIGCAAGLVPLAIHALVAPGTEAHWTLHLAASVAAGAAVGWVLKR